MNNSNIDFLNRKAESRLIPQKSNDAYKKEYDKFMKWVEEQKVTDISERVMLAYLQKMSEQYKASTMWAIHSKLQCLLRQSQLVQLSRLWLRINKGVDIKLFAKVHAFMKAISKNDVAKKAYVFNEEDLRKFFIDAPDITYLFLKVVAICGIFGSCRRCELCDLRLHDIKEEGSVLIITIRPSKTVKARRFTVADSEAISYVRLTEFSYDMIRGNVPIKWLVLIHLDHVPRKLHVILNWMILQNTRDMLFDLAEMKGGIIHQETPCTSATIMANSGMTTDQIQRQVGWKSSAVATGYVEESISNKKNVSNIIGSAINGSSTSLSSELTILI
ncbi:hypothetical protein NQ315_012477 [Exocentrus adspersus]|uniref:Tyr recombinase domain-containing protein n=1 Tax=Exocentrus adspersus TaxID=1586481 RepID=A0AAV8VNN2_9CUCU|nr:hypothetical protein NQ315_012477 [Exocentrus adspersus]